MGSRLAKNSSNVRKRIENPEFHDEGGEEYEGSKFGGFTEYMRRKKIKLQNLDAEIRSRSTDKPAIFRGVVAHVNGYTQPSLTDLHNLIVSHGGGFLQYLDGKTAVTHVVVSHLTPKKKVEFARYRIVKPAWVVDSVEAGRLLPWDAYRVVHEGVKQKLLGIDNGNIVSQSNNQRQGYRDQSDTSWYTSQIRDTARVLDGGAVRLEADDDHVSGLQLEEHKARIQASTDEPHLEGDRDTSPALDDDLDSTTLNDEPTLSAPALSIDGTPSDNPSRGGSTSAAVPIVSTENRPPETRSLTAEEHNAILLQNPHLAKSSTANPDFLNQYYRESRLHHLSTWKADLKAQLQARAQEKSSQKQRQKSVPGARRYIMHVDFDSFFAAVSLRKNVQLVEKPVVIAHGSGPGSEIASCNYPARKYGVKNGMWMKTALELCPELKVLPYDYKAYEEASRQFYDSILAVDGVVQSISIDEALVDVSTQCIEAGGSDGRGLSEGSIYREQEKAQQLAQDLRISVKDKTGCDVSVGIGNNILLAKVALRKAKPAGQHLIKPEEVLDFIGELTVTDLPGVAWSIGNKLEEIGIKYVKDIRSITKERLINTLGPKTGEKLWDYSRGIDKTEVGDQVVRKSVSAEVNWGIRFVTQQQAEDFIQALCDELSKRLLDNAVKGKQLTMKIMRKSADAGMDPPKNLGHGKCDTFNKSVVLGVATNDGRVLGKEAISILRGYGFSPGELRGLGVQMQKLEPVRPLMTSDAVLFDGSQRRLQFKKPDSAFGSSISKPYIAPITSISPVADAALKPNCGLKNEPDQIEDVATPEKPKLLDVISGALNHQPEVGEELEKHKPLNIAGTQFIVPSQVDPAVLAELPADIRAKLAPKQKSIVDSIFHPRAPQTKPRSRSTSPFVSDSELALPTQSQLDPEILNALPDDVRQEVLAHYRNSGKTNTAPRLQQVLPQSPRKGRPILPPKKLLTTPTKKHKISTFLSKARSKPASGSVPTLTQSNFVSLARPVREAAQHEPPTEDEISQAFLDELPEDIRLEILTEQKRNRMKANSGLNVAATTKRRPKPTNSTNAEAGRGQQKLRLPAQSERPTFTSRKLSTLSELREAMSGWVDEFSSEGEDGPFQEDVDALVVYLQRVIVDEHDMAKAVAVVDWVSYLVADHRFAVESTRVAWNDVLASIKEGVRVAVKQRGLSPIIFDVP